MPKLWQTSFTRALKVFNGSEVLPNSGTGKIFSKVCGYQLTNVAWASRVARKPVKVYMPGQLVPPYTKEQKEGMAKAAAEEKRRAEIENPRVDNFVNVISDASKSRESKNIVLEGERLVEEGLKNGLELKYFYLQDTLKKVPGRLADPIKKSGISVETVSSKLIKKWSSLTTPPGVIGVFRKPKAADMQTRRKPGIPLTVICDNIREPGNLGSILRSAAGVGCKNVLLTKGCVDLWDGKVLRSGCGAHFHVPTEMNFNVYDLPNCILTDRGEGTGASSKDVGATSGFTRNGKMQSTNGDNVLEKTSASALPSFALFLADNKDTEEGERNSIPLIAYTDVEYGKYENIYLVVGGETEGLSRSLLHISSTLKQAHPFFENATVARLRIPLSYGMESLNSSHAFSIISYEILRQLSMKPRVS